MSDLRYAFVVGSFSPYHRGHDHLIRVAARECRCVDVFVSLKDRGVIRKSNMVGVFNYIVDNLPKNVRVMFVPDSPVREVYRILEGWNLPYTPVVYTGSDSVDYWIRVPSFVEIRPVSRDEVPVSGTNMRRYLETDQKDLFLQGLPDSLDKERIWKSLIQR